MPAAYLAPPAFCVRLSPRCRSRSRRLRAHFKHKLLIRSNTGITPTEAGLVLYRHAQLLLKQIEQAKIDIDSSSKSLAGRVSIGLATYSTSSALSLPILKEMKALHPQIIVHINDSFGHVLSELIMTGKMDMAVIYGSDPIKGVTLRPLFREELFLVSPPGPSSETPRPKPLPLSALGRCAAAVAEQGPFPAPPDRRIAGPGAGDAQRRLRNRVRSGARRGGDGRPWFDHPACFCGCRAPRALPGPMSGAWCAR